MSGNDDLSRWSGKVALVTGASSGIGAAVARDLAMAGLEVFAVARRMERLQALAAGDGKITAVQVDLRDTAAIEALFADLRQSSGGIDVLINNAGLGHAAPLMSGSTEQWRDMLEVNVLGLCVATREAVRDMRRRGDAGHVIHISSMAAHRVPPGSGVYSATKYAVRSLTEGLRQELRQAGSGIRVTAISPGYVETEFAEQFHKSAERARETYSRFPVLQPADVAAAVRYVLAQPAHVQLHDLLMRSTEQPG